MFYQTEEGCFFVLLEVFFDGLQTQCFYGSASFAVFPAQVGGELGSNGRPVSLGENRRIFRESNCFQEVELACPSRVDGSIQVNFRLAGDAYQGIGCDFIGFCGQVVAADCFDPGILYVQGSCASRRVTSELRAKEEVFDFGIQGLVSCNGFVRIRAKGSRYFGLFPGYIGLQGFVEVLNQFGVGSEDTTAVFHTSQGFDNVRNNGFFVRIFRGRFGNDAVSIETGLGKDGDDVLCIGQRNGFCIFAKVFKNLFGSFVNLVAYAVVLIQFAQGNVVTFL